MVLSRDGLDGPERDIRAAAHTDRARCDIQDLPAPTARKRSSSTAARGTGAGRCSRRAGEAGPVRTLFNAGWLSLERAVQLAIGFFVTVLVARHLGPDGFGVYAYLFGLAGVFGPLAMFGLEPVVMRRLAADPQARDVTIGSALVIRGAAAILGAGVTVALVAAFGGPAGTGVALAGIAALTLLVRPAESFNAYFKARECMARVALPRIAASLAVAGVTLWLVWQGAGVGAFVGTRAAEAVLFSLAAFAVYAVSTRALARLRVERATLAALLREGLPLMLSGFATMIALRIDQVMLGQLSTAEELGLYGVAVRVADLSNFVPVILQASFYASLVRAFQAAPERFDAHVQRLYDALTVSSLAMVAGIAVASALLFVPTFGAAYAGGLPMLAVLLCAVPFFYLSIAAGTTMTVRGWFWTAPLASGGGALVNIGLNLVLIPAHGGMGAAVATVISYMLAGLGFCLAVPRLRPAGRGMLRALNPVGAVRRLRRVWAGGGPGD